MMAPNYLVTGGAGFIGSSFIRSVLAAEPSATVVNLDALTYAGVATTVAELDVDPRHTFVHGDIRDRDLVGSLMVDVDIVVHFAAETHVDRSITDPATFLETNVVGTGILMDAARRHGVRRFIHVSTDEVYGSVDVGAAREDRPLSPSSPYSASKAASDLLVRSFAVTFDFDAIITRCTNNFGPYQFPEKVIPLFVTNLLDGRPVPLYGDGRHERDWLHVSDHCRAISILIDRGTPGEIYNIGADNPLTNLDLTHRILKALGSDETMIERTVDRPGHDLRYAVDSTKIRGLGWKPEHGFDEYLTSTIEWYRRHRDWWEPLRQGAR